MKFYRLNAATLKNLKDVVAVIDALGLQTNDESPIFDTVSKYFNIEVEVPQAAEAAEAPAEAVPA